MKKLIGLFLAAYAVNAFAYLSESYQTYDAQIKQDVLWRNISEQPYAELPEMKFFPNDSYKIPHGYRFTRDAATMGQAFDHRSDEMPEGRVKIIHAYGSAAKVEFVPATHHPFTGLFRSGAVGVARLSLGVPFASTGSFVPGMAIKFLVDGQPSKNMHVMQRLEGQGDNRNFFKFAFTNKLPEPIEKSTRYGAKFFGRFVKNPIFLRVDHVAELAADGARAERVVAPYQIFFQPAEGVTIDENAADFRVELTKLAEGTKLYEVFGTYSEHVQTPIYIGSLYLRSPFVASAYGDKVLYFQHEGALRRSFWLGRDIKPAPYLGCVSCPVE